jgi:hypothetical protein
MSFKSIWDRELSIGLHEVANKQLLIAIAEREREREL